MTSSTTRSSARPLLIAAPAAAVLLLAACSSGSDTSSGGDGDGDGAAGPTGPVFEFQPEGVEPADEITIRVPDGLREAMGAGAEGLIAEEITATAHELDGVDRCAVDLAVTYGDGQPDALLERDSDESRSAAEAERLMEKLGVSSVEEVAAEVDRIIESNIEEGTPGRTAGDVNELLDYMLDYEEGDTGQDVVDRALEGNGKSSGDSVAGAFDVADLSGAGRPIAELDAADPEQGAYVSEDLSTLTAVGLCSASPNDEDDAIEASLPLIDEDGDVKDAATVEISVMTDGTLGVMGEVSGYVQDANGNWIAD